MLPNGLESTPGVHAGTTQSSLEVLRHTIDHVAHLLPSQGPITVFVHHNTLHAFEDLPFAEALREGSRIFGCQPFLPERQYHEKIAAERIQPRDLEVVLSEDLGESGHASIAGLSTRLEMRLNMVRFVLCSGPPAELEWLIAETDALRRFRQDVSPSIRARMIEETRHWAMRHAVSADSAAAMGNGGGPELRTLVRRLFEQLDGREIDYWTNERWEEFCLTALWGVCRDGMRNSEPQFAPAKPPVRHRDLLQVLTGEDSDRRVHDVLVPLTAAFLDQGLAHWELPDRSDGLFRAFLVLFSQRGVMADRWLRGLRRELNQLLQEEVTALESIQRSLAELGVGADELEEYLLQTLLALRGWAGMIWQMETRADRVVRPAPPGTLIEFLAVRLILERHALTSVLKDAGYSHLSLAEFRSSARQRVQSTSEQQPEQQAFFLFQLAQVMGWSPPGLYHLSQSGWTQLLQELLAFDDFQRRRILQLAYERRYRVKALDAICVHAAVPHLPAQPLRAQVICCIDDREESFRRHLEEIAPDIETFGAPGFFAVVMYFQGAADAHFTPLCPIIIRPQHWVTEDVMFSMEESHLFRRRARQAFGRASHQVHVGTRSAAIGAVLATVLGPLASLPMVARILFPRYTARMREAAGQLVEVPRLTQLVLERQSDPPGSENGHIGFALTEMATAVERLLRDIGMTRNFAPLVLLLGHGSSSLNNPHESAYNCGACAGSRGGPNARAFAQMANDPRVRRLLQQRGIEIPAATVFLGGYHNTCDDAVDFFDLDRLPGTHRDAFMHLRADILQARRRNALERCRRFESAPLNMTPEQALLHVEARAEDLAQARPEYNHATNAICYVGRRERTRSLYMDRRSFLQSYDAAQDDAEHSILLRILQAAIPVCAGISLEYYFSTVDPVGWGCGNKLPHNVVSLLGVMEGALSDLRTGLSAQMVEIHEPMRLLFIVESTPEAMLSIMSRNDVIRTHIENDWVQLAVLDPNSSRIQLYKNGRFENYTPESEILERAATSRDWYRGWRDHLEFAAIEASEVPAAGAPSMQLAGHS